ncbi:uncharacterized protein LOC141938643 [Strix uralensis]|uniref:uncharacterized protein LOC141938643 n=1 Tax=Strix uralensis TaxID=36305 RepID=UPI003DA50B59
MGGTWGSWVAHGGSGGFGGVLGGAWGILGGTWGAHGGGGVLGGFCGAQGGSWGVPGDHHPPALLSSNVSPPCPPRAPQLWGRLSEVLASEGNYRRYRALLGGAGGGGGFRLPALGVHLRDWWRWRRRCRTGGAPRAPTPPSCSSASPSWGGCWGGGEPPRARQPRPAAPADGVAGAGADRGAALQLSLLREPRGGSGPPPRPPPPAPWTGGSCPTPPARPRAAAAAPGAAGGVHFPELRRGRRRPHLAGGVRGRAGKLPPAAALRGDRHRPGRRPHPGAGSRLFPALQPGAAPAPPGAPPQLRGSRPLRPGGCGQCGRLILGLHKQELKCRTCGLRCHTRCRDRLRVECRRRTQSVARPPPGPPGAPPPLLQLLPARPRRGSLRPPRDPPGDPPEPPPEPQELQELQDGVFDIRL